MYFIVPVIAIFTKFDARDHNSFSRLQEQGQNWHDAKQNAEEEAEKSFQTFVADLNRSTHRPKDYVFMRSDVCFCMVYSI